MHRSFVWLILSFAISAMVLPTVGNAAPDGKVKVFAGILPAAYFVERVGGANTDVGVLVAPGQDPHTFEPSPKLMTKLADSQILFKTGFPFEEVLVKKLASTVKNLTVVDLQQGITLRPAEEENEHHGDAKEEDHHHEAEDMDPHTWLDPRLAKIQAQTIADALIRIDPSHRSEYENNLKEFQKDLDAVHEKLTKALAPVKGKSFFVFHPAYGYLGDAYGLKQVPVQMGGKDPSAKQLAGLIKRAKEEGVKIIFVQPQFSKKSAETLARSIGGAVVVLDDLSSDYLNNLQDMAAKLDSALRSQEK